MSVENKTELQKLRESYGVSIKDLVSKLNMRASRYKDIEKGQVYCKEERNAKFYYDVAHALEEIKRENYEKSQIVNASFKMTSDGELEEELVFQPITNDIFQQAIHMLKTTSKSYINISIILEIDADNLYKKIINSEYAYLIDDKKAKNVSTDLDIIDYEDEIVEDVILNDKFYQNYLNDNSFKDSEEATLNI